MAPQSYRSILGPCAIVIGAAAAPLACGDHSERAGAPTTGGSPASAGAGNGGSNASGRAGNGGSTGGKSSSAGTTNTSGAGESSGGIDGGGAPTDEAGAPGSGGTPDVVMPGGPFVGMDPYPCSTDDAPAPAFTAQCSPSGEWADGKPVPVDAAHDATLISATPDELTLVWSEGASSVSAYYFADRANKNDDFGRKVALEIGNVIAASPDGLRLVVLSPDQLTLATAARADRASDFAAPVEGEFEALNADAKTHGWTFTSCAFAPDDRTLYYAAGTTDERYPVRVSTRSASEPWPAGKAIETCEFEAHAGYPRYPTGASADGKTLFFYDSWRGKTRAAWRAAGSGSFTWFHDVGDWFAAQPNSACDRLYYSAGSAAAPIESAAAK